MLLCIVYTNPLIVALICPNTDPADRFGHLRCVFLFFVDNTNDSQNQIKDTEDITNVAYLQ